MTTDLSKVVVTTGATADAVQVHHRDFPEIRAEGETPKVAAEQLVNHLTRALDTALTNWRRDTINAGDRRRAGLRRDRRRPDPIRPDPIHIHPTGTRGTHGRGRGRDSEAGARAGAGRRDDDRHGLDDRLGHLHHLRRDAPGWSARRACCWPSGPWPA